MPTRFLQLHEGMLQKWATQTQTRNPKMNWQYYYSTESPIPMEGFVWWDTHISEATKLPHTTDFNGAQFGCDTFRSQMFAPEITIPFSRIIAP